MVFDRTGIDVHTYAQTDDDTTSPHRGDLGHGDLHETR